VEEQQRDTHTRGEEGQRQQRVLAGRREQRGQAHPGEPRLETQVEVAVEAQGDRGGEEQAVTRERGVEALAAEAFRAQHDEDAAHREAEERQRDRQEGAVVILHHREQPRERDLAEDRNSRQRSEVPSRIVWK
jgi:hypothetical protein